MRAMCVSQLGRAHQLARIIEQEQLGRIDEHIQRRPQLELVHAGQLRHQADAAGLPRRMGADDASDDAWEALEKLDRLAGELRAS
jgi:hypothetical protein